MENIGYILIIVSLLGIIKNYKKNIIILLCLELFFIGISLLFLNSSIQHDDMVGALTTIIILCLSATESAIALTLLISSASK